MIQLADSMTKKAPLAEPTAAFPAFSARQTETLYVKQEMDHVAVLHHVVFPLGTQHTR